MKFYVLYIFLQWELYTRIYKYVSASVCVCVMRKKSHLLVSLYCLTKKKSYVYQSIGVKLDITFVTFFTLRKVPKKKKNNEIFA